MVVFDGGTVSERENGVLRLGNHLKGQTLAKDVRAVLDLSGLERWSLYFLSLDELQEIEEALEEHHQLLSRLSQEGWYGFLEAASELQQQRSPQTDSPHRTRIAEVWRQAVEGRGRESLGQLFPRADIPPYSFYADGDSRHILFFRSDDPLAAADLVYRWAQGSAFSGRVVVTGQSLLQAQERREALRDAAFSTVLALIVVQAILVWGFRETARPRLAFLSLFYGLCWATAWAAYAVGTLNIITINFLAITVGLGVDFSIHLLARYCEERRTQDPVPAMESTLRSSGVENLVGALATSVAFFALFMTEFEAVRQLGVITGIGVLLCFLSVAGLLPPLLYLREKRATQDKFLEFTSSEPLARLELTLRAHPLTALTVAFFVVVTLAVVGSKVRFDYNLLNLQSDRSPGVRFEKEGSFSSLAAFYVVDIEQARAVTEDLESLESVAAVQSVVELFPLGIEEKIDPVRRIVEQVKGLPEPSFSVENPDWEKLRESIDGLTAEQTLAWVETLKTFGPGPVEDVWLQMQGHLHQELTDVLLRLKAQECEDSWEHWTQQRPELKRHWAPDGRLVLRVQARGSLWERRTLERFVSELESSRPGGLGPPFLIRNYLEQLRRSYFDAVRYALVAIVVLLLLHFRAWAPTMIALVPKISGAIAMFAVMAVAGIDLNPANCMALPLTLGIGLVFGIHAVHRCLEEPDKLLVNGPTGRAISLSGWTTVASFGTLMTASHPGIFSLGFVMAFGVAANMLATYLTVPPLVEVFRDSLIKVESQKGAGVPD